MVSLIVLLTWSSFTVRKHCHHTHFITVYWSLQLISELYLVGLDGLEFVGHDGHVIDMSKLATIVSR